eukprot:Nitzschia sp. Nitz4//scaffold71_size96697//76237//76500//NITZ4_004706-RA/size96697-processed-gene-0.49-mRNA-1//-1//CDS//3329557280//6360//frame0
MFASKSLSRGLLAARRVGVTTANNNSKVAMSRRTFFSNNHGVPETQFTPAEDLMLDGTAWFVAIAMCFPPQLYAKQYQEDDDHHNKP